MELLKNENILLIKGHKIPFLLKEGGHGKIKIGFKDQNHLEIFTYKKKLGDFEEGFLRAKSNWILKYYSHFLKQQEESDAFGRKMETEIPVFGIPTMVVFEEGPKNKFLFKEGEYFKVIALSHQIENQKKQLLYYSLRAFADRKLKEMVQKWAEICTLEVNTVRVKDLKSKWGSCSGKRNINLNWHLILLEKNVAEYVVIHELMHLHEMNHSAKFWSWVQKYCPSYKSDRQKLKSQQWIIGILS